MARKRKPYRNVRDRNFFKIANMPQMENKAVAIEWIKNSEVMVYIFQQARNWNFLVSTHLSDEGYLWEGVNYGKEKRNINREIKSAYGKKIFNALVADEVDFMPPLRYRSPAESFVPLESEVIKFLATKKNILNLVFVTSLYNGQIIRNEDGSWIGKNRLEC